jgi:hypothetical protein
MGDSNNLPPATLAAALPEYKFDGTRPDLFIRTFKSWVQYYGCQMALNEERPERASEEEDLGRVQSRWDELNERAVLCIAKCTSPEIFALLRDTESSSDRASNMLQVLNKLFPPHDADHNDFTLQVQLLEAKQESGETVLSFASRLHEILVGVQKSGERMPDGLKVMYLARRLSSEWRTFADHVLATDPSITYDSFRARMFKHERETTRGTAPIAGSYYASSAISAIQQPQQGGFRGRWHNRGARSQRANNQHDGNGRGQARWKNQEDARTNSQQQRNMRGQIQCGRCLKNGHSTNECYGPMICRSCGGTRHKAAQCTAEQKQNEDVAMHVESYLDCFMVNTTLIEERAKFPEFVDDSVCTVSMVKGEQILTNIKSCNTTVTYGNGTIQKVNLQGSVDIEGFVIQNVLLVPNLRKNLLSETQLTTAGLTIHTDHLSKTVYDPEGRLLFKAHRKGMLYIYSSDGNHESNLAGTTADTSIESWHYRLGHLNVRDLKLLKQ